MNIARARWQRHKTKRRIAARKYAFGDGTFSWGGEFAYLGRDGELSLVVTMLRADSCDALRRGDTGTMNALDDLARRLEAGEHRR